MTREIKFRAWNGEKMFDVSAIDFAGYKILDNETRLDEWSRWKKDCVLMQFTGLLDKNGKEIYEGDIVIADDGGEWFPHEYDEEKDEYYPTGKYLVEYDSEFARFILIDPKTNCEAECDYNPFSLPDFTLEVIGNKFQNPELLKEVKNEYTVCMESF